MDRKFWNWVKNETKGEGEGVGEGENKSGRTLYLDGVISESTWWGDEVTPKMFKDDLYSGDGDITVWINSPGGDVFAAAQIYNMLKEYPGMVTVKIDGIAASAASVVAMAGAKVYVSPVSMLMVHNPWTFAWGDSEDMRKTKDMLDEVKQGIINAYEAKTGMSRVKLANMMDDETWMNAKKAVELGFADEILYTASEAVQEEPQGFVFSRIAVNNSLMGKFLTRRPPDGKPGDGKQDETKPDEPNVPTGASVESLMKRLSLLPH